MSVWRPSPRIRVKALGLHWCAGRLLAAEVRDDSGGLKGVRPLGGSVEFGETARAAVVREFREELGIEVAVLGEPQVVENLFRHEGARGHEIVFLFEVRFPEGAFDGQDRLVFREDGGADCVAAWHDPAVLDGVAGPALYPDGLRDLLATRPR